MGLSAVRERLVSDVGFDDIARSLRTYVPNQLTVCTHHRGIERKRDVGCLLYVLPELER